MQLKGFQVRSGYIIAVGEWELDLHNDYDFVAADHDRATASARVLFRRSRGDWVDKSQPESVALDFDGVSRFVAQPGDPSLEGDRKTIRFIGFLYLEDNTMHGCLDDHSEPAQDLIVGFEDESAVKVHADLVAIRMDAHLDDGVDDA